MNPFLPGFGSVTFWRGSGSNFSDLRSGFVSYDTETYIQDLFPKKISLSPFTMSRNQVQCDEDKKIGYTVNQLVG